VEQVPLLLQNPELFAKSVAQEIALVLDREALNRQAKKQTESDPLLDTFTKFAEKYEIFSTNLQKQLSKLTAPKAEAPAPSAPEPNSTPTPKPEPKQQTLVLSVNYFRSKALKQLKDLLYTPVEAVPFDPTAEKIPNEPEPMPVFLAGVDPKVLEQFKTDKTPTFENKKEDSTESLKRMLEDLGSGSFSETGLLGLIAPGLTSAIGAKLPGIIGALVKGIGVTLLGGLAIGLTSWGMATDGPEKGLMKIGATLTASQLTKQFAKHADKIATAAKMILTKISGAFKFILKPITGFFTATQSFLDDLLKGPGLKVASAAIAKGSGKGLIKMIGTAILNKLKFALPFLRKIPIIGTIIGLGFAVSRFMKGDVTGGIIDVVSAIAGLANLVAPGLGLALQLGLDGLNAFLDVKYGGASPESSAKKWEGIKGFMGKLWEDIKGIMSNAWDAIANWGPIKWLLDINSAMAKGIWDTMETIGFQGWPIIKGVLDFLTFENLPEGMPEEVKPAKASPFSFDGIWDIVSKIKDGLYNMPVIGDLIKAVEKDGIAGAVNTIFPWMQNIGSLAGKTMEGAKGLAQKGFDKIKGIFSGADIKGLEEKLEAAIPEKLELPEVKASIKPVEQEAKINVTATQEDNKSLRGIEKNTATTTKSILQLTAAMYQNTKNMVNAIEKQQKQINQFIGTSGDKGSQENAISYGLNYLSPVRLMRSEFIK
jgi:hypothetical protein